ncbi:MAG: N-acetyltransferase [Myxococcales bacterium]|nr:MAG: N-acetyltransferase [Myxococcales bacterium]
MVDLHAHIGKGTKIWHFSHVSEGARIGDGCILGQNVFIGRDVQIGNGVKIQNNVSVYSGVVIEDDVFLGPSCVFTNVLLPRSFVEQKQSFSETRIRVGATIGANATIVCGNNIGHYAMIGAGSVVTHSVPDFALVMGVPAKQLGWVDREGKRRDTPPAKS